MLNKDGIRELAYVVKIDNITPIDGYDRVELAHIAGWTVVVGKDQFKPGDLAIYFEIDSKLPEVKPFIDNEFLVKKHFKVKTQKMCKSISQGLIMPLSDWTDESGMVPSWVASLNTCIANGIDILNSESRFLTKELGVTYADADDNKRKSSVDKYKKMAKHHPKLFSHQPFRWLMKRTWGKKLLFIFFGKAEDRKKKDWPEWVVKTDEERCQNLPFIVEDKSEWIATEKIDGTSTTATVHKKKFGKGYDFYICSRNVVFDKPDKKCFYEKNYYTEMAEKYKFEEVLTDYAKKHDLE